jgi:hypothetical protein
MHQLLSFLFALVAFAQYPGYNPPSNEIPDDRPEVRRRVESFEKLVKDAEKDADAVAMLDGMITMFKDSAVRDRGRVLKSIVGAVKNFDVPKDKAKPRNLPVAAAEHMAQMGTEALKSITELLGDRSVSKEMPRVTPLAAGLVKLGTGTAEALEASVKLLDDPNPRLYSALAQAFTQFQLETQAKRKRIAGAILTSFETFQKRVDADKSVAPEEKPKLADAGRAATIATLNVLAVQKQPDVAAFKAWFAENKAKEWPEK